MPRPLIGDRYALPKITILKCYIPVTIPDSMVSLVTLFTRRRVEESPVSFRVSYPGLVLNLRTDQTSCSQAPTC